MPMIVPVKFGRAMTVVRGDDGLVLFNSMRLSDDGLRQLESFGEVKHVIRLAGFHGRDDGFYRDRYGATVYAVQGQSYFRGMDPRKGKPFMEPDLWLTEQSELPLRRARLKVIGSCRPPEALCLLERDGGILIAGDSLQHTPKPDEYFNFPAKLMMKRMGFMKPYNVGPGWLQFARPSAADVRSILELDFAHVLPSHGDVVIGDAREKYRPAIEGELKGCHD
jgi:glyoxylase-like metal-dependent hydrolase (beta-lactamase superfamily II)